MSRPIPYNVTSQGAVVLWPADLDDLVFGPGLDLDRVAEVERILAEAVVQQQRHANAVEAAAKVVRLDDYRHGHRAVEHRPERGAQ